MRRFKLYGRRDDALVKAEWNHLYAKKRYIFALADLTTGELRVFDATKNQAKVIIASIDEYAESLNDLAFTFKRVGGGKDTSYNLSPIIKMKAEDKTNFDAFNDEEVTVEYFETILQARSREEQIKELKDGGFPVAEVFGKEAASPKDPNEESKPHPNFEVDPEQAF